MRFLIDRCAGVRVAAWLRQQGHDVAEIEGPDPGDLVLLARAQAERRVLVTLDKHFLQLIRGDRLRLSQPPTSPR